MLGHRNRKSETKIFCKYLDFTIHRGAYDTKEEQMKNMTEMSKDFSYPNKAEAMTFDMTT